MSANYRIKPKCAKISVSLFDADVVKLDALMGYVNSVSSVRIDRSLAVKLFIRMGRSDPHPGLLAAALAKIRSEDGRR